MTAWNTTMFLTLGTKNVLHQSLLDFPGAAGISYKTGSIIAFPAQVFPRYGTRV
jgi:hypothetical protein